MQKLEADYVDRRPHLLAQLLRQVRHLRLHQVDMDRLMDFGKQSDKQHHLLQALRRQVLQEGLLVNVNQLAECDLDRLGPQASPEEFE